MVHGVFNRPPGLRLVLVSAIAVACVGGAVIAVRATLMKASIPDVNVQEPRKPITVESERKHSRATMPAHVLVLRPNGFEPSQVSWPKGRFFLTVENHTRARELKLQLSRENGDRLKEVTQKMRRERGVGILDLHPGEYVLSEASHPNWACRITITPQ